MAGSRTKQQEAAASSEDAEEPQGPAEGQETGKGAKAPQRAGVSGPGTGKGAPADEQDRMPSTTVLPSEAGPLVPTDVQKVNEPELGHPDSSTDAVAASVARRSVPGSNHVRLLDEDDNEVTVEEVFTEPQYPAMFVETRLRLFQEFTYEHASTPTRQLLYPKGVRVPVAEAERFRAAMAAQARV